MKKVLVPALGFLVLALACGGAVWADTTDPTGFCPPPGSVPACTTGTGIGNETIPVGSTTFVMEKNGGGVGAGITGWNLLVAIPNFAGSAPVITSPSFTQVGSASMATLLPPTPVVSVYDLFGLSGDSSMNNSNMFGANEQAAFGGTPAFFEVFDYQFTGPYTSNIPYTFNIVGSSLAAGTFLAATEGDGTMGFSTPYTTAGLVNGPTPSPEPGSLMMLGAGLLGLALISGRRVLTA